MDGGTFEKVKQTWPTAYIQNPYFLWSSKNEACYCVSFHLSFSFFPKGVANGPLKRKLLLLHLECKHITKEIMISPLPECISKHKASWDTDTSLFMFLISTWLQVQFRENFWPTLESFTFLSVLVFFTDKMMVPRACSDNTKTAWITGKLSDGKHSPLFGLQISGLDRGRSTHLDDAVFARIVGGSRDPPREKDQG